MWCGSVRVLSEGGGGKGVVCNSIRAAHTHLVRFPRARGAGRVAHPLLDRELLALPQLSDPAIARRSGRRAQHKHLPQRPNLEAKAGRLVIATTLPIVLLGVVQVRTIAATPWSTLHKGSRQRLAWAQRRSALRRQRIVARADPGVEQPNGDSFRRIAVLCAKAKEVLAFQNEEAPLPCRATGAVAKRKEITQRSQAIRVLLQRPRQRAVVEEEPRRTLRRRVAAAPRQRLHLDRQRSGVASMCT